MVMVMNVLFALSVLPVPGRRSRCWPTITKIKKIIQNGLLVPAARHALR